MVLPQNSGLELTTVTFHSQIIHRKYGDKVGKTEAVWIVFQKTDSHAQGMLDFRKLGSVDFLQSREKAEGSLVSSSRVFIQQAGSLPSLVKQRESGVTLASVVRGPVSVSGQDTVYPKPAFLSTLEHLSPAGSVGAVAGKRSELPVRRTFSGPLLWAASRPGALVRLGPPACPSDSKSNLVQRMFLVIYKIY